MLETSLIGSFLAGLLFLFLPPGAMLLPMFLAYAFLNQVHLAAGTLLFPVGLLSLFIPLALGAAPIAVPVLDHQAPMVLLIGAMLMLFGGLECTGRSLASPPSRRTVLGVAKGRFSIYLLGVVYGVAVIASGSATAAISTIGTAGGDAWSGGAYLAIYALGMSAPLFILALIWDHFSLGYHAWLQGGRLRLFGRTIRLHRLVAGAFFLILGAGFAVSGGSAGWEPLYENLGLLSLAHRLDEWAAQFTRLLPDWVWASLAVTLTAMALLRRTSTR